MRRIFVFATVVVVALAMGMGGPIATVTAQENATNATDDELEESEPAVAPAKDYLREIDNTTRVTDWEYRPGMFTITFEADEPTTISMTEAGDFEEGMGSFNYKEAELEEGTNHITMPVTDRMGAGVAIATEASLEQGGGASVSIGQREQNPFRNFGGESGLFSGVGLTVSMAGLGAWYVVRSEETGVIKA